VAATTKDSLLSSSPWIRLRDISPLCAFVSLREKEFPVVPDPAFVESRLRQAQPSIELQATCPA
jgi:hypothetical protein